MYVLKIICERCELVKLCHINCSGPVFLRHTAVLKSPIVNYAYSLTTAEALKSLGHN